MLTMPKQRRSSSAWTTIHIQEVCAPVGCYLPCWFVHNSTVHSSTGMDPAAELLLQAVALKQQLVQTKSRGFLNSNNTWSMAASHSVQACAHAANTLAADVYLCAQFWAHSRLVAIGSSVLGCSVHSAKCLTTASAPTAAAANSQWASSRHRSPL